MTGYDPNVAPGDPPTSRELAGATIRKLAVSAMSNNVYLITSRATGAQLLIDAADDAALIGELIREGGEVLEALVTTHSHWDHVRALPEVARSWSPVTYAGADDAGDLPVAPDVALRQGDKIAVGDLVFDVVALRGHTPGSVALYYRDADGSEHLFSGDSLFPGGVGATGNPGQDFDQLFADVSERVFGAYSDSVRVYPGHGGDTTLGAERPHLDEWQARGW